MRTLILNKKEWDNPGKSRFKYEADFAVTLNGSDCEVVKSINGPVNDYPKFDISELPQIIQQETIIHQLRKDEFLAEPKIVTMSMVKNRPAGSHHKKFMSTFEQLRFEKLRQERRICQTNPKSQ